MASSGTLKVARLLSTSSKRSAAQSVKAPVQLFNMEGRYATALYTAAAKSNQLDNVVKEISNVKDMYTGDLKFRDFVKNPTINKKSKKEVMRAILQKLNFGELTQNFFDVVSENGRMSHLDSIIKSFDTIMSAHRGEVLCEVITAKPLEAATMKELEGVLKTFVKENEKLSIGTKVDSSLIGGMVVSIGDKYVDMSIARKIRQYEKLLTEAV